jgi:hypothetical protein
VVGGVGAVAGGVGAVVGGVEVGPDEFGPDVFATTSACWRISIVFISSS